MGKGISSKLIQKQALQVTKLASMSHDLSSPRLARRKRRHGRQGHQTTGQAPAHDGLRKQHPPLQVKTETPSSRIRRYPKQSWLHFWYRIRLQSATGLTRADERIKDTPVQRWCHLTEDKCATNSTKPPPRRPAPTSTRSATGNANWPREPTVPGEPVPDTEEPFIYKDGMLIHHGPERLTLDLEDFIRKQQDARHAMLAGYD